ncbi:MAG: type II toxin-antitoxin system VapC family toxin [Acidobacteria bacterium]|nr:type II toxin-antitoxin system VapC family toxin [Acidobacteriota bacterium]
MRSVYLDTNVPSFLVTTRDDHASQLRRTITQQFWSAHPGRFRLFLSELVIAELSAEEWPGREQALAAIRGLPLLPITDDVTALAGTYLRARIVPASAARDAVHLACASVHGVNVLLTWNVRQLANPTKVERLRAVNLIANVATPVLCTPESLLEDDDG